MDSKANSIIELGCRDCGYRYHVVVNAEKKSECECPKCKQKNSVFVRKSRIKNLKHKIDKLKKREKELRRFSKQNTYKKLFVLSIITGLSTAGYEIYVHLAIRGPRLAKVAIFLDVLLSLTIILLLGGRIILTYEYQPGSNPLIYLILGILLIPFLPIDSLVQTIRSIWLLITSKKTVENY